MSFRILATSDTHFNFDADALNTRMSLMTGEYASWFGECDTFIHAGDLMYHGTESEWDGRMKSLATIDAPIKLYVPGNHDMFVQHYTGPANQDLRHVGFRMLGTHPKYFTYKLPNSMVVLGLPYVTGLPGWGFNDTEENLDRLVKNMIGEFKPNIVVTHSPPAGILDGSHYGVEAWNYLQRIFKPEIWICGHVHENYGMHASNGTTYYNVSMLSRDYKIQNRPMLIEVDE